MPRKAFFITAPIYYVNDKPHVGHAYSTIVADTLARTHKALGEEVYFVTGTDENSQKTVDAALQSGENSQEYADRLAKVWQRTWQELGAGVTHFIRTTSNQHKEVVYEIWRRIAEKGYLYQGIYEGLYCKGCETFIKESELTDGLCPVHKTKPDLLKEKNYFFTLSKFEKALATLYDEHPDFIVPPSRLQEIKNFMKGGLEDISISRETKQWGIPVPGDSSQVIYVWFDALISYISAIGLKEWEAHGGADVHVIGKDITRFHAIIWPAMLLAADLPLPRQLFVNGFFTIDGVKISKSLGNAINPLDLKKLYGEDALRYFLLREIPFGEDGDFSLERFKERYNADLANGLGNLVSRVLKMAVVSGVRFDYAQAEDDAQGGVARLFAAFSKGDFSSLQGVWHHIREADVYVQENEPFKKIKTDPKGAEKDLRHLLGKIYVIGRMLEPVLPATSKIILDVLRSGKELTTPLFPRIT